MIPTSLDHWTYDAVSALCSAEQFESERHDFKVMVPEAKKLTQLCCALANSSGAFVVIGVSDTQPFQIVGVEPDKELFGTFVAKVRASPDIPIEQPKAIVIPASPKLLYVFEIKRSQRSPHLPIPADERIFWKRQGSSCVQMTLEEIRYQMNNYEEKREKLTLLMIDLRHKVEALNNEERQSPSAYSSVFGQTYSFDIIDRVVVEAYSFLKNDPSIFKALDSFRTLFSALNAAKQRLLMAAASAAPLIMEQRHHYQNEISLYTSQLASTVYEVTTLAQQIQRSIKGIANVDDGGF